MRNVILNKLTLKKVLVVFLAFFVIYTPRFSEHFFNLPTELFEGVIFVILIFYTLFVKKLKVSRSILLYFLVIVVASLYFTVVALLSDNPLRIVQNIFILIKVSNLLLVVKLYGEISGKYGIETLDIFFITATLQFVLVLITLISPSAHRFALDLYYLGGPENQYISRSRIYGISGDYTFFTPIYHGMLVTLATFLYIFKSRFTLATYGALVVFLLTSILTNGRFGLIIALLGSSVVGLYYVIKHKKYKIFFLFLVYSLLFLLCITTVLYFLSPYTLRWIYFGFKEVISVFTGHAETTGGSIGVLINEMIHFPKGLDLIFGAGHRVYGVALATSHGLPQSDIGFVNDLYMGGLIYVSILYIGSFYVIINRLGINNRILAIAFILILLVANGKGEVMRSGLLIQSIIVISDIIGDGGNENVGKSINKYSYSSL